ncbi:hypothetical protein BH09VER1_BH09VER1_36170 [soil metagenome]
MTTKKFLSLAAMATSMTLLPAQADVHEGYKTPSFTIPYAEHKPTIDGIINDTEWESSFSIQALQTTNHAVSPRPTRFWLTWDEDNLYVAMRSPLRAGERLLQVSREKGKDVSVIFDDSYEIWVDAGTKSDDGQVAFFQFISNFAGARSDVMIEPAVGNSRPGWNSGWEPVNRITPDGKFWEMEVAIPRKSIFLNAPFADGQKISCLLARNFKRPWEQNSVEGTGSFSVCDTYSHFTLSKSAPALHLLEVADPEAKTFGLKLATFGTVGDAKLKWSFDSDGGTAKTGIIDVKKGQLTTAEPGMNLDSVGPGSFRIRVTSEDGKTSYLDWSALRTFGFEKVEKDVESGGKVTKVAEPVNQAATAINDKGDVVRLLLQFNPVKDYLRVTGDFIQFDERAKIDHCEVVITSDPKSGGSGNGKELARDSFKIDDLSSVRGVVQLKDVPYGAYVATMTCYAKDGSVIRKDEANFTKKDPTSFPWWNTKAGNIEKVLAPWTPVKVSGNKTEVWGRTMTIGAAGLPSQIVSAGKNLLAGPASLQAEMDSGKIEAEAGKVSQISQADFRYVADATSKLGDLDISSRVTVEYDGMYKVEMTLKPKGSVKVGSLKMVVPIAPQADQYIYGKAEEIRSGFDMRFVPKEGTGVIWDCRKVGSTAMTAGSFIPYVWVGNTQRGLCWFADSDQGWTPNAKTPAVELVRDTAGGPTKLIFNLISSPDTIDQPRTIVFAFQASPVKALSPGWRMNTWWCGDTFGNYAYPDNKGALIWQCIPFTTDIAASRKMVDARHVEFENFPGGPKRHSNAVPYFGHDFMGPAASEQAYFGEEWQADTQRVEMGQLWYGKTLRDFIIYNLDKWIKDCGIDGWYLDNVRPIVSSNIDAGRGYRLPDGRIQPTFDIFGMREFFLRLRAIWQENGKTSLIVNHMTNNMILPWNEAVDVAYDGEHNVIYPEMGKDFMDLWSLERLRMDYPEQWGVAINFMREYQGVWEPVRMATVMRAYLGAVFLHDALPTGNSFTEPQTRALIAARDRFGIGENDVKFLGYWDTESGLSCTPKDVHLAGWLRPGKLMLAVVNFGEKTNATVQIDAAKLGLGSPSEWKVSDAEEGTSVKGYTVTGTERTEITVWDAANNGGPVTSDGKGGLKVPVNRHDFRLIVIEKK